jgi:hypothetical protein
MKRKTLFLEVVGDSREFFSRPDVLDVVRDYASLGFLVTPIDCDTEGAALLRDVTGAKTTRPLNLSETFDPTRVWDLAREYSIDISRCVFAATKGARDGVLLTAGVHRLIRLRRRLAA